MSNKSKLVEFLRTAAAKQDYATAEDISYVLDDQAHHLDRQAAKERRQEHFPEFMAALEKKLLL